MQKYPLYALYWQDNNEHVHQDLQRSSYSAFFIGRVLLISLRIESQVLIYLFDDLQDEV